MELLQEAGYGVWLVLAAGVVATVLGARFAVRAQREGLPLVVACIAATLLAGCLATAVGVQVSAAHLGEVPDGGRWIFLLGVREAMQNLVLALGFSFVSTIAITVGLARGPRARDAVRAAATEPT